MKDTEIIGKRIRVFRQSKGLSVKDLSNITGIAATTIYGWETKNYSVPLTAAIKVAEALKISVDMLVEESEISNNGKKLIPIIATIHAGLPAEAIEEIQGYVEIEDTRENRRINAAIRIEGDSMEPRLYDGDIVFVSPPPALEDIPSKSIVVARIEGECLIRRYIRVGTSCILQPDNQHYDPVCLNSEAAEIVALAHFMRTSLIPSK